MSLIILNISNLLKMAENQKYKAMSKFELADFAGVSWRVFKRWLTADFHKLNELGYSKTDKLLNPAVVKFLCEKYVIIVD